MSDRHSWGDKYEAAMAKLEPYIITAPDGTFVLEITDGKQIGIDDPILFADLKRSLEETNRKIKRGEIVVA